MPSAAPRLSTRRDAHRPCPRVEPPSAPLSKVSASEAVSREGRLGGQGGGRAGVSAPLRERAGRARSRQLQGSAIGTRPQLCSATEQASGSGGRYFSTCGGRGLPGPLTEEGYPRPGPEPGADRDQPRWGGCSCAGECGLPPRQLSRAPGFCWDHLFPVPAGLAEHAVPAAPPPLQLASSQRPLQTGRCRRRLRRCRRCRACAPQARTPAGRPHRRRRSSSSGFH